MKNFILILFALTVFVPVGANGQSGRMITIPADLYSRLRSDDAYLRKSLPGRYNPNTESESERIFCDEVDLNGDGKPEYLLTMIGGNSSGPIWIYRKTARGYEQLLKEGTMTYSLLKTKTGGYYDLKFEWGGNSGGYYKDIYSFNGKKYVRKSSKHRMDRMPT